MSTYPYSTMRGSLFIPEFKGSSHSEKLMFYSRILVQDLGSGDGGAGVCVENLSHYKSLRSEVVHFVSPVSFHWEQK